MTSKNTRDLRQLSYSMLECLQSCPKRAYWRYVEGLATDATEVMRAGTTWHGVLETWYALGAIPNEECDLPTRAMYNAYCERWGVDDQWNVLYVEHEVTGPLLTPNGRKAPGAKLKMIADLVIEDENGDVWIVEHKSKSSIDANYLSSLWMSRQPQLYALYLSRELNRPIAGVIYNLAVRPSLKRSVPETEEEFETRRAGLKHPDKAKRREGETDEEYLARCAEWYADSNAMRFHREVIVFTQDDLARQIAETYDLYQQWRWHVKQNVWPRATSQCYPTFGSACAYCGLCAAADPALLVAMWRERLEQGNAPVEIATQSTIDANDPFAGFTL